MMIIQKETGNKILEGTLIVLEGLDGSGKTTQINLLKNYFQQLRQEIQYIKLPDYAHKSSAFVTMYLSGEFGDTPQDVNAYAASLFYAVDRYASFHQRWSKEYLEGKIIIADRYTTSNAVHQMVKLPEREWKDYLFWLSDLEYGKLQIPAPNLVIYLDVPPETAQRLMSRRYGGDEQKKDIHESNLDYLNSCRKAAFFAAKQQGWKIVRGTEGNNLRTVEDIHRDILTIINKEIHF